MVKKNEKIPNFSKSYILQILIKVYIMICGTVRKITKYNFRRIKTANQSKSREKFVHALGIPLGNRLITAWACPGDESEVPVVRNTL